MTTSILIDFPQHFNIKQTNLPIDDDSQDTLNNFLLKILNLKSSPIGTQQPLDKFRCIDAATLKPLDLKQSLQSLCQRCKHLKLVEATHLPKCVPTLVKAKESVGYEIEKSKADKRLYKFMVLKNKVQVLLISDPKATKSAVAYNYACGSMSTGKFKIGMPHFLEHALFLGSEKYPEEDETHRYLAQNGGSTNAFTSSENTCFFYDVRSESFEGAFDRMTQCQIAPLFAESCLDREVNAVDNECKKDRVIDGQNQQNVLQQLIRDRSHNPHEFSIFGCGNKETLKGVNKTEVQEFWKLYHKVQTSCVLLSNKSLDELEHLACKYLPDIPKDGNIIPKFKPNPFKDCVGNVVYYEPMHDLREIKIYQQLDSLQKNFECGGTEIISFCLNFKGEGSFSEYLKDLGYANSVYGSLSQDTSFFAQYCINVDLTVKGLNNVYIVVVLIYSFLNQLSKRTTDQELQEIAQDIEQCNRLDFRFIEEMPPIEYVQELACSMMRYPPSKIIKGPFEFSANQKTLNFTRQILKKFVPENSIVFVVSKEYPEDVKRLCHLREQYFGAKYGVAPLNRKLIRDCSEPVGKYVKHEVRFALPRKCKFFPQDSELKLLGKAADSEAEANKYEVDKLENSLNMQIWHKFDTKFEKPRAFITFKLNRFVKPDLNFGPEFTADYVLSELAITLLDYVLQPKFDIYSIAGYSCSIGWTSEGLSFGFSGQNAKLPDVIREQLNVLQNFQQTCSAKIKMRFKDRKELLKRRLENAALSQPYVLATKNLSKILYKYYSTPEECLAALHNIEPDMVIKKIEQLLFNEKYQTQAIFYGNIAERTAMEVSATFRSFKQKIVPKEQKGLKLFEQRCLCLKNMQPKEELFYSDLAKNDRELNCCSIDQYQLGYDIPENRAIVMLFAQMLKPAAFQTLRTEKQLGYIATATATEHENALGMEILVQSATTESSVLDLNEEEFLNYQYKNKLEKMEEKMFLQYSRAVITNLLRPERDMSEKFMRIYSEISRRDYVFDRHLKIAGFVRDANLDQMRKIYLRKFLGNTKYNKGGKLVAESVERENKCGRRKISSRIYSKKAEKNFRNDQSKGLSKKIDNITKFKKQMEKDFGDSAFYPSITDARSELRKIDFDFRANLLQRESDKPMRIQY